jgi:hypothetical protein
LEQRNRACRTIRRRTQDSCCASCCYISPGQAVTSVTRATLIGGSTSWGFIHTRKDTRHIIIVDEPLPLTPWPLASLRADDRP